MKSNEEYIREAMRGSNALLEMCYTGAVTEEPKMLSEKDFEKIGTSYDKKTYDFTAEKLASLLVSRCFGFKGGPKYLSPNLIQVYELKNGKGKHNSLFFENAPAVSEIIESLDIYISSGTNKLEIVLDGYAAGDELSRILIDTARGSGVMQTTKKDVIKLFTTIFPYDFNEIDRVIPLSMAAIGSYLNETDFAGEPLAYSNTALSIVLASTILMYDDSFGRMDNGYKAKLSILNFILPMLVELERAISISETINLKLHLTKITQDLLSRLDRDMTHYGATGLEDKLKEALKIVSNETDYNLFYANRTVQTASFLITNIINRLKFSVRHEELNV